MKDNRENLVLETLKAKQSLSVKQLCNLLYASESTVRRLLSSMEQKGLIVRSHGKAFHAGKYADKNVSFLFRENLAGTDKDKIAEAAVKIAVKDGSVIMADASSTVMRTIEYLKNYRNIIVITSGIKTLFALSQTAITFFSTGGQAINQSYSLVGQTAIDTVKTFNADVCFISCHGLSEKGFATDTSETENDLRRAIMQQSKRKILLIDSTKLNVGCWHNLCNISEFDDVFCDSLLPENVLKSVKNFHLVNKDG